MESKDVSYKNDSFANCDFLQFGLRESSIFSPINLKLPFVVPRLFHLLESIIPQGPDNNIHPGSAIQCKCEPSDQSIMMPRKVCKCSLLLMFCCFQKSSILVAFNTNTMDSWCIPCTTSHHQNRNAIIARVVSGIHDFFASSLMNECTRK